MPINNIEGISMIFPDFSCSKNYWEELSNYVTENYGKEEITDNQLVQQVLKECFKILEENFMNLINNETRASFYLYTNNFHENSIELWRNQIQGNTLPIDEGEFATTRRILKIILEQSCGLNLIGAPNFQQEIENNNNNYQSCLEELLYLGYRAYTLTEYIATSQLIPNAIGINIEKDLEILTYEPYNQLLNFIKQDIPRHDRDVQLYQTMEEFKNILREKFGIDYNIAASIVNEEIRNPDYRYAFVRLDQLINYLVENRNYNRTYLSDFYNGLTLSRENYLSFEDCILRNQKSNRYTYRPILKLNIDGEYYCLIGRNKWGESLSTLSTNALPFGICPEEWKKYDSINKFITEIENNHDKILENPAIEILQQNNFKFDNNIKSIKKENGNNIRIDKQGIGEIDLIYLDEENELIYIGECKHNRSRFSMYNWRRDYNNFKNNYENTLERKVNWLSDSKHLIEEHFKIKYNTDDLNLSDFNIRGIFIINAPTFYMYNGKYRAFTVHEFNNLIRGSFKDIIFKFKNETNNTEYFIRHPYFDNLLTYIEENG
jgi:hypothetical protein